MESRKERGGERRGAREKGGEMEREMKGGERKRRGRERDRGYELGPA